MTFDKRAAASSRRLSAPIQVLFLSILLALAALIARPAAAQSDAAKFFEGKQITLLIGSDAGNGYDVYGRIIARHMEKYLPHGAKFVVKNMPGATGVVMTNYLTNVAPADGLTIGLTQREAIFEPIFTPKNSQAKYDPRTLAWIGTPNQEFGMFYATTASGIATFDDFKKKTVATGTTGGGAAQTVVIPKVINAMAGTKFKMITGYSSGLDVVMAMERGEVDARFATGWAGIEPTKAGELIAAGKARLVMTFSMERKEQVGSLPTIMEAVTDPEYRAVLQVLMAPQAFGRPVFASPNVPADRLKLLRDAYEATMKDSGFTEDALKAKFDITPLSGPELAESLKKTYALPASALAKTIAMMDEAAATP